MNTTKAISAHNLTKVFGKRIAVNDLNLEIKQGEIFSLLGTNGAGKTTTIKMLCCLLQPQSGNAFILGHDIKSNPLKVKELIGVSPQETAIAGHLTTRENLLLMGGISGLKRTDASQRAATLMELLELENRKDQAMKLSGGLQRRLSIGMALMSDPKILFLDEPTLGLDPHARKSVWNYIEKLKTEKTILLTTHYLEEADSLADRIAIMDKGNIIACGSSSELKSRYASGRTLCITGDHLNNELMRELSMKGLEAILANNKLEITGNDPDIYTIVALLQKHQIKITGIQFKELSLDDVFLQLTNKEILK